MELQAVIMAAGRGSRMSDLTAKCPKALLPIGNMPMVWYPIIMLERAGFDDAIVVVPESFLPEFQKMPEICDIKLNIDFVGIPEADYWGTADSLRHIQDKIKTDILVISCDLISDVHIYKLANIHRKYDASLTMMLSPLPASYQEVPPPGVKSKRKPERDFVGFDETGDRVLFYTAEADLVENVKIKKSLLKRHPLINIKSTLSDCHMYILKRWVVNYLSQNTTLPSLCGDVIPYMVRKQFSKPKIPKETDTTQNNSLMSSPDEQSKPTDEHITTVRDLSSWLDHQGDLSDCYHGDKLRCYAHRQQDGFCVRTNTLSTYFEANKQISRFLSSMFPKQEMSRIHQSAAINERVQIGTDCMVGDGTTINEKVSVKRSVIGKHCVIGDKVKIANSVIMDHVTLAEGCNITGCIVASNSTVGERCELKDSIIGSSQSVKPNSKITNEAILETSRMMDL